MFGNLGFFISEAFIGMRRSSLMTTITVATITISLVVFGLFLLISVNLNHLASEFSSRLEMRVYLKNTVSMQEVNAFKNRLNGLEEIQSVTVVHREEAWQKFQLNFKHLPLLDLVNENPLPHSYKLVIKDQQHIEKIKKYMMSFESVVDEVNFQGAMAQRIQLFSTFSQYFGLSLVGLLTFATLLIIMNTIRLTILARKDEVTIMKLVGATHRFIQFPFLIEGLLIGIVGSFLAMLVLKYMYALFGNKVSQAMPYFPLVTDSGTLNLIFLSIVIIGTGLGVLGAYFSISRTLKSIF